MFCSGKERDSVTLVRFDHPEQRVGRHDILERQGSRGLGAHKTTLLLPDADRAYIPVYAPPSVPKEVRTKTATRTCKAKTPARSDSDFIPTPTYPTYTVAARSARPVVAFRSAGSSPSRRRKRQPGHGPRPPLSAIPQTKRHGRRLLHRFVATDSHTTPAAIIWAWAAQKNKQLVDKLFF